MDLRKIGKFVQTKRKEIGLTQTGLAEKLGVTDRAVSKWENGVCLPDADNIFVLCDILKITVNDFFNGEISMDKNDEKTEKTLVELLKQKQRADKRLLSLEVVIMVLSLAFLTAMLAIGIVFMTMEKPIWIFFLLVGVGMLQFIVSAFFAVRIEQVAGYYECAKCGHRYIPTYKSVNFAMHLGRTRYMKCPKCGKNSWQKKVLEPEENLKDEK